jgi:hypothetical protein
MKKKFRKSCQAGCFSIILLGIFIGAVISSQSYVMISEKYAKSIRNSNVVIISLTTYCDYRREWFKYVVSSPYTFYIEAYYSNKSGKPIRIHSLKLINRSSFGRVIEIDTSQFMISEVGNKTYFELINIALEYDDYDVMIGFTYEENGTTKKNETDLELKREPSIKRGNYFLDLFKQ